MFFTLLSLILIFSLPVLHRYKNSSHFLIQYFYDLLHFILYQFPLGAYISYLSIFYLPVLVCRKLSGLFSAQINTPLPLDQLSTPMLLLLWFLYWDFLAYLFHRLCHLNGFLWSLHKYHHSISYFTGFSAYRVSFVESRKYVSILYFFFCTQYSASPPLWLDYCFLVFQSA